MARALLQSGYGKETPIRPGLLARFTQGVREEISSLDPTEWFGPAQPLRRVAPSGVQPRRFDYPFGINLDYTPKAHEGASFEILRELADSLPLLRNIIETRKDQVSRVPHSFQVRALPGEPVAKTKERQHSDKRVTQLDTFFDKPDGEHCFSDWQRMILEDMLVIDAPAVLPRWRRDGKLYGFDVIDGATISLLVDENGRAPMPPDPFCRQILKGVPAVDIMQPDPTRPGTDQVFYRPRNVRTNRMYGYSPVEQSTLTINLALRQRLWQLSWFTDGTIPDVFINAPDGVNEDTMQRLETVWNEKFATPQARRKANFIPFGAKVEFAKQIELSGPLDELIIRELAYAFGVTPASLVKMVNRAAGQQMSEDAKAEGLEPVLYWWKGLMDELLEFMGCGDLEYVNGQFTRENPLQQAQIDQIYLSTIDDQGHSVLRANEVREDRGYPAIDYEKEDEEEAKRQQELTGENPDEEDAELRQQQTDRADTARPKAVKASKKKSASRLEKRRRAISRQLPVQPGFFAASLIAKGKSLPLY